MVEMSQTDDEGEQSVISDQHEQKTENIKYLRRS